MTIVEISCGSLM